MRINDLSSSLKNQINLFYQVDDKPLFIYDKGKLDKTKLGKEILKNYQLNIINSYDIKRKNITDDIVNTISKKNITLMFNHKKERGYIIDDLEVFQKMDKKNYKEIINFLKKKSYRGCKIIVIFNEILYKKKELNNIDSINLYLGGDISIQKSQKTIDNRPILKNLLENKKNIQELIDFNLGDENVFLLNLLENIYAIVGKECLNDIYEMYIYYDSFELFTTQYHIWELKEYSKNIIMRYIYINSIYKSDSVSYETLNNFKYNSYISKSILSVSLNSKLEMNSYIAIYICLYMINKRNKKEYEKYLENVPKKTLQKLKKIYSDNY